MKKLLLVITVIAVVCSSFQKKKKKGGVPACIKQKMEAFAKKEKYEQPQNIVEYEYKGKKVYYVTMACCDFFNELYDSSCNLMGHPDGGITGKGDGKLPDFNKEKKKEKIIWNAEQ
jgi:hypothetical protein